MSHTLGRKDSRIFYYHIYFILLFPKETDLLNVWTAWAYIPYLVHSGRQWFPEDRNRCTHEATRHKLILCYTGVEGHVQGHRWKLSPCRRLLSTQRDSHSCRWRKKTARFELDEEKSEWLLMGLLHSTSRILKGSGHGNEERILQESFLWTKQH